MDFSGVHTAIVTPFKDGTIDREAFKKLINNQLENGISGIVPAGTTGESPTLSHPEHEEIVGLAIEETAGRSPVIAGTGSNSTREAIRLTQAAEKAGADASLQVCPYYNKPSQEGLYQHFKEIAESTALPIVLYSIPGRCVVEISIETIERLVNDCSNIHAVKEASGNAERISQIRSVVPKDFSILSGDDSMTLPFMSAGACGVISVASNIVPKVMVDLVSLALNGDWDKARGIHEEYYSLFSAFLKAAVNPVPIKTAMGMAGMIEPTLRLPLVEMESGAKENLKQALDSLKLI